MPVVMRHHRICSFVLMSEKFRYLKNSVNSLCVSCGEANFQSSFP